MATSDQTKDFQAIKALIGAHFDALRWSPGTPIDWPTFTADFLPDASLFPAARPVTRRTLEEFMKRMDGVAQGGSVTTFEEKTLGMQVLQFGNIAVVLAASEMLENGTEVNHDISGYLLVKNEEKWLIAAHAWDKVTKDRPVPEHLRQP
jgi:hypothetical protein